MFNIFVPLKCKRLVKLGYYIPKIIQITPTEEGLHPVSLGKGVRYYPSITSTSFNFMNALSVWTLSVRQILFVSPKHTPLFQWESQEQSFFRDRRSHPEHVYSEVLLSPIGATPR